MLKLFLWASLQPQGYTLPDELDELLEDSACFNCTVAASETEMLKFELAILAHYLSEESLSDIASKVKCLPCLKPGQINAATLYLQCLTYRSPN